MRIIRGYASRVEQSERGRCDRAGSIAADDNDTNSHCHFGYPGIHGFAFYVPRVGDAVMPANKTSRH